MMILKAGSRPPWVGLGAAVWVQFAAGNGYTFPLYSPFLKSVLGLNQQQLTLLGVAIDIGGNLGILPGVICNKFPPWVLLLIGSLTCFLGYGVLWLAVSQTVNSLPYCLLWFALCIAGNSNAWFGTSVLVTNMRNFPLSRGTVAGILKGYIGLSAAVYTEIYSMVLNNSSLKLLLFLTLGVPVLCFAMMYFIRPCTPASGEDSAEHGHFLFTQSASVALGIFLLTTTVLNDVLSLSSPISYTFIVIMILILMAPLTIPIKMTLYPADSKKSGILDQPVGSSDSLILGDDQPVGSSDSLILGDGISDKTESLLNPSSSTTNLGSFQEGDDASDVDMLLAEGEGAVKKKRRRPKRGEDFKFREALIKADFWLLFLVFFLGVGSGATVLNNLAQIGIAQGVDDTTILLSLFSFCNFLGRLGGGAVSEHFVRSKTIPRTVWMTCTQVIMVITYLLFASALTGTLYAATALFGICYGVQFSIMVPTASDLFGLKHFGVIYNFVLLGSPLGALLFSSLLAGYIYDMEVAKQQGFNLLNSNVSCLGPNCFRITFLVLAGVCGLSSVISVILTMRIRTVYQMLYAGGSFRLPQSSHH